MDSTLREVVADMLDGIYNVDAYGGRVKADRGKRRIDVWNESIAEVGKRVAPPDELALMLMRSSRVQKISRNGVYITVCGEKLYYRDEELHLEQGKEVYVRYDPEHLEAVRLYEAATDVSRTLSASLYAGATTRQCQPRPSRSAGADAGQCMSGCLYRAMCLCRRHLPTRIITLSGKSPE